MREHNEQTIVHEVVVLQVIVYKLNASEDFGRYAARSGHLWRGYS